MNLIGIENITPYEEVYEFSIYQYEDKIDLGDSKLFICDLKVIITRVKEVYKKRIEKTIEALALVSKFNNKFDKCLIKEDIKEFIFNEIYEENLEKENIQIVFIEG